MDVLRQHLDDILDSVVLITGTERQSFGTGFAIHSECGATWILTCAHVLRDVSEATDDIRKADDVWVENQPAEVLACGQPQEADLAVLKVKGLAIPPLKLDLAVKKEMHCRIAGFAELAGKLKRAESLASTLGSRVIMKDPAGPRVKAWQLRINDKNLLKDGYSGSPVVCIDTGAVVAVTSHSEDKGECGYAISLINLKDVWSELPSQLLRSPALASGFLVEQQREFLDELFRNPPVSLEQLYTWCRKAMPPDLPCELAADSGSLDLLDWLEGKRQLSGGLVPLLFVLRKLLPRVVDPKDRSRLQQCINKIGRHFDVSEAPRPVDAAPPKAEGSPALMLEIWPEAPPGKRCNVQAWLIHSGGLPVEVYTRDQDDALNVADEEGLIALVEDLYGILSKRLSREKIDEKTVILEFVLPREFLGWAVEQWTDGFGDPVGIRFPVVVRSRERLRDPKWQLGWETYWDCLSGHGKKGLCDSFWWFDESQWRDVRDKVPQGSCIGLCFVPDLLAPRRRNAVLYLLHHGAAVILWPRLEAMAWTQQFQTSAGARTVGDLPEVVRELRYKLWRERKEIAPCYNLTLLWDDPSRRIPDEARSDDEFLQGPTE